MIHMPSSRIGNARLIVGPVEAASLRVRRVDTIMSTSRDVQLVIDAFVRTGATRLILVCDHRVDARSFAAVPAETPFYRAIALPTPETANAKAGREQQAIAYWFGRPSRRGMNALPPACGDWREDGRIDPRIAWLLGGIANRDDVTMDPDMADTAIGEACVAEDMRFVGICATEASQATATKALTERTAQGRLFATGAPEDRCARQATLL